MGEHKGTLVKTRLGKRFSEGARRLWLLMEERGWCQTDLVDDMTAALARRAEVGQARSRKPTTGLVSRWLYGEREPDRDYAVFLHEEYTIDAALWSKAPEQPFTPPAARLAA
jgi:hypothetical protein